jgi:hypothetical protein
MKEFNDNPLKKIANNCRKATYLIEKKLIDRISFLEALELKIHLTSCSICKTFEKQSVVINRMVKELFHGQSQEEKVLDEQFKADLQSQIEQKLNNIK